MRDSRQSFQEGIGHLQTVVRSVTGKKMSQINNKRRMSKSINKPEMKYQLLLNP